MATTSFIEHLPNNVCGKDIKDKVKVVHASNVLNGHIIKKQIL